MRDLPLDWKKRKISGKENEIERNISLGLHLFYLYEKHLDGSHQNQTLNFPPLNNKMQVLISSEMLLCTVQTKISWPLDLWHHHLWQCFYWISTSAFKPPQIWKKKRKKSNWVFQTGGASAVIKQPKETLCQLITSFINPRLKLKMWAQTEGKTWPTESTGRLYYFQVKLFLTENKTANAWK